MRHLILPDTHNQWRVVNKILENQSGNYGSIVFLGDHFDSFGDNPDIAKETASWLNEILDLPNAINLFSNHDIAYAYSSNRHLWCSGFTQEKTRAIFSRLDIFKFREKTKFFHRIGNFLFSHAGVSRTLMELLRRRGYFEKLEYNAEFIEAELNKIVPEVKRNAECGQPHPLLEVSYLRGGRAEVSGLTWCDSREFQPIPNVVQVFGHTPQVPEHLGIILCKQKKNLPSFEPAQSYWPEKDTRDFEKLFVNGCGVCIDSHLQGFAILDDETNKLVVFKVIYDKKLKEAYLDRNIVAIEQIWERTF